jgi:HSP20 family protein
MPETRQKNEESVRVIEKDPVASQLEERQGFIQDLERRVTALQNDFSNLVGITAGAGSRPDVAEGYPRLAPPPYFSALNRFGSVSPNYPAGPAIIPGSALIGGSPPQLSLGLASQSEALTTRDFSTLPSVTKQPHVNIVDVGEEYIVRVELPGATKKDLELLGSDRSVTLTARVRSAEPDGGEGTVILAESAPTVYRRTIHLPSLCNTAKSRASLKDGCLTLTVPKKDPTSAMRRIDVAYG